MKKMPLILRIVVGTIFLLVQCTILYLGYYVLDGYSLIAFGGEKIIAVFAMLYIMNRDEDSGFKLSWIFLISVFTIFGVALYIYTRKDLISGEIVRRLDKANVATAHLTENDKDVLGLLNKSYPDYAGTCNFISSATGYLPYSNTTSEYFKLGDDAFPVIKSELEKAESYIFIEFFIINAQSTMWQEMYEILCRKANSGVDVRVIFDAMGSAATTPKDFAKKLQKDGIKCSVFSPIRPFLSTFQNNRNHRKIIVIDGKTAFSGGINISDEYINKRELFGHWKDNSIKLNGDAVKSFALMFVRMWAVINSDNEKLDKFFEIQSNCVDSKGFYAPFDDVPSRNDRVGKWLYTDMLNTATDYVYIMTPYLVLDDEMKGALKFAAKRGVKVKIVMPHIPDKWYAFALARTYYPELIKAGVEIYEYIPGFVHSKVTVSDNKKALVGTVNYDYRSLYLHYECGVYMCDTQTVLSVRDDICETIKKSKRFTLNDYKATSVFMRIIGRILRVFAPLM